jgi:hypothetical protein
VIDDDAIDALLRRIPDGEARGASYDDGRLLAITRGGSDDALEAELAHDPEGRALLAELAAPLPEDVRRRAIGAMPGRKSRGRAAVMLAVTTVLASAAAVLLVIAPWSPERDEAAYAIEGPLGGVREVRGGSPSDSPHRATDWKPGRPAASAAGLRDPRRSRRRSAPRGDRCGPWRRVSPRGARW